MSRESDSDRPTSPSTVPASSFQTVNGIGRYSLSHIAYYINDTSELYSGSDSSSPAEPQSKLNPIDSEKHGRQRPDLPSPGPRTDNNLVVPPNSISHTASTSSPSHLKNHFSRLGALNLKFLNPALVLQNSGSVARDHLASERTFLAYVRTSLGFAAASVAIVQLFAISDFTSKYNETPPPQLNRRAQKFAMPFGILMLVFALLILFLGK